MSNESVTNASVKKRKGISAFPIIIVGILSLAIIGMVAYFNLKNRERMGHILHADVDFVAAPQTVSPGVASHFVIQVVQDRKDEPLAGRVLDVTVTPMGKAEILAVTGDSNQRQAVSGTRVRGRTDGSGKMDITLRALEPGRYTLTALDSASNNGGTVNFRAVEPEG